MYIYIYKYIYIYIYVCVCVSVYMYIQGRIYHFKTGVAGFPNITRLEGTNADSAKLPTVYLQAEHYSAS